MHAQGISCAGYWGRGHPKDSSLQGVWVLVDPPSSQGLEPGVDEGEDTCMGEEDAAAGLGQCSFMHHPNCMDSMSHLHSVCLIYELYHHNNYQHGQRF